MFHRCGMMWVCCTVIIPRQIECQTRPSPCACFEAPEYLARMIQDRTCSQLTHYYKLLDTRHRSSIQACHETRAHMRTDPHTHTHVYIFQTKAVFGMFTYPFFGCLILTATSGKPPPQTPIQIADLKTVATCASVRSREPGHCALPLDHGATGELVGGRGHHEIPRFSDNQRTRGSSWSQQY